MIDVPIIIKITLSSINNKTYAGHFTYIIVFSPIIKHMNVNPIMKITLSIFQNLNLHH